jgi:hypothetical protein
MTFRKISGYAILVLLTVQAAFPAVAGAESAIGSSKPSSRIMALGSWSAWLIPDRLTDMTYNPARVWDAGSFTLNYRYGNSSAYAYPFPMASGSVRPQLSDFALSGTSEVTMYGASAWGWKWALVTEWDVYHDDRCQDSDANPFRRMDNGRYSVEMSEYCYVDDNNFVRMDLAAARRLGDLTVLGLRAGGFYRYYGNNSRNQSLGEYYEYDGSSGEYLPSSSRLLDNVREQSRKTFGGYLEAGMAWNDSSEIVLRGGYARGDVEDKSYYLRVQKDFERFTGVMEEYDYRLEESDMERDGSSWLLSLMARKQFEGGLAVALGGSYERGGYDSDWGEYYDEYSWGGYNNVQALDRLGVPADGTRSRSYAAMRAGKTYTLEDRLDLTPGVCVVYEKEKFEEDGVSNFSSSIEKEDNLLQVESSFPVSFAASETSTSLYFPVSIEFRAASFFSLYSGFRARFTWRRDVEESTSRFAEAGLEESEIPDEMETEDNAVESGFDASLGFSLRFREKLFLDMYTGTTIVPQYITSYVFDLRYVF